MQRSLAKLLYLTAAVMLTAVSTSYAQDKKVDPTGTWTWSATGRGGQTREVTLKLKFEGDKLTGTIPGRNQDTAIEEGKIKGDEISFVVNREFQGNKVAIKYNGKISGDTIKGKIERTRGGEASSSDWEAKRAAAKKESDAK